MCTRFSRLWKSISPDVDRAPRCASSGDVDHTLHATKGTKRVGADHVPNYATKGVDHGRHHATKGVDVVVSTMTQVLVFNRDNKPGIKRITVSELKEGEEIVSFNGLAFVQRKSHPKQCNVVTINNAKNMKVELPTGSHVAVKQGSLNTMSGINKLPILELKRHQEILVYDPDGASNFKREQWFQHDYKKGYEVTLTIEGDKMIRADSVLVHGG